MKYEDILAACLDRLRRGESIDALVAENPQHAEQLRLDLSAAASVRSVSTRLPSTSSDARARFQRDLQAQRRAVAAAPQKQRGGWFRWSLGLSAIAAAAAALLVGAVLVGGVFAPADTAEASFEGVIVENDGATLTVQTETGLQTVSLADAATVSSTETGSEVALGSLEPGQLLLIRGTRAAATTVVARRIELRAAAEVAGWCDRFPSQCVELEKALSLRAERCQQNAVICQRIRTRLQEISNEIASRTQLGDLRTRCEQGTAAACRELQDRCSNERPACASVREFLRNRAR